ncbi:MAG: hypothetical protein JW874_05080, partial [Spirochaetales bacterium]|nr:hypothetical protein [Spirochaetales bacterium]
ENDINTVYIAGKNYDREGPLVMKSTDGGDSWQLSLNVVNNANVYTGWSGYHGDVDWWWGNCALGFTVSQSDPDRAVITDMGFVHLTDDGGLTWRQAYVDPNDQNPPGADTPKSGFYASSGVDQTATWWLTWMSEDILFASMTDINSVRSPDGGLRWQKDANADTGQNTTYRVIKHPQSDTFYAATSSRHDMYESTYLEDSRIDSADGEVKVSYTAGASWELVHDFEIHPVIDLAFDSSNPEIMYASVADSLEGGIYRTDNLSDGPDSDWVRCAEPPRTEGHPYNIEVLDDGTLVVTYSGRRDAGGFTLSSGVFVSSNHGDSFSDVSIPEMQRWTKDITIDPNDPDQDTWYVCVFSHWGAYPNEVGGVYRTRDRGENWELIAPVYRAESCTVDPLDPDHMYVTTETEGLWETFNLNDDEPAFTEVDDYPFSHPMRVFFNPYDENEIWVTSFGGGVRVMHR